MIVIEAIKILDLLFNEYRNPKAICNAWKKKMLSVHPDKCHDQDATKKAQTINEAKDVLLEFNLRMNTSFYESAEAEKEAQRKSEEKEQAKRQTEEKARKREEEVYRKRQEEIVNEALRRSKMESDTKSKRKTRNDTRIHKNIKEYKEGRELMKNIKHFVKQSFIVSDSGRISMNDIVIAFRTLHNSITPLKLRLFRRHFKSVCLAKWPSAKYTVSRGMRSYKGICLK